jgi:anaerobic magnesium-protoporphyrin IX monomethyl ester cyclase
MVQKVDVNVEVLLVYPPVMLEYKPVDPPYGLMYVAAVLREAGISVSILDLNALRWDEKAVKEFFKKNKFKVVGIGGMTTVYYYAKWLSTFIRGEFPSTKILAGGSFVTPCPEIILNKTDFDAACLGESEVSVVELVRSLLRGSTPNELIKGIAFKRDGKVVVTAAQERIRDIGELPLPAYDLVDIELYLRNSGKRPALLKFLKDKGIDEGTVSNTFIMFASRGCPFECTFCYRNFGRVVRRTTADALVEHIRYVKEQFGANNIAFYDEIFNANRKWVIEIANRLKDEFPDVYFWIGGARIDLIDEEVLDALKAANFYEVSVGVESFDDRILKEMDKNFGADVLLAGLKLLKKYEMAPSCIGMLYGFPGDDEESLRKSEEAIIDLGIPAYYQFPLPFPGTYLYDELKAQGRVKDEEAFMLEIADQMTQELFINLSKFTDEQLISMVRGSEARIKEAITPLQPVGSSLNPEVIPWWKDTMAWKVGRKIKNYILDHTSLNSIFTAKKTLKQKVY